jgi:ankyrin repeat protein
MTERARRLLAAARDGDAGARALLEGDGGAGDDLDAARRAVARRFGFAGWAELARHLAVLDAYRWDPTAAVVGEPVADRYLRLACLTYTDQDGPRRRAEGAALLAAHPELTAEHIWAAAAASDVDAVERLLAAQPGLATARGGPYGWTALAYLAYARPDATVDSGLRIARALLAAGADPDEGYAWRGLTPPFTLLTGAFGGGEQAQPPHAAGPALAALLLEAGADPNDGQSLYNRQFTDDDTHLALLLSHGLGRGDGGPWRQRLGDVLDPPADLVHGQLSWAVVHGQADRVALLLAHGADAGRPFLDGRSPAATAAVNGNTDVLALLRAAGAPEPELDPVDRFVAAAMAGDAAAVEATPAGVLDTARRERAGLVVWAAARLRYGTVRLLVSHGFDVNALGRADTTAAGDWQTALHEAAGGGELAMVRLLLELGADRAIADRRFNATPAGWAVHFGQDTAADLLR